MAKQDKTKNKTHHDTKKKHKFLIPLIGSSVVVIVLILILVLYMQTGKNQQADTNLNQQQGVGEESTEQTTEQTEPVVGEAQEEEIEVPEEPEPQEPEVELSQEEYDKVEENILHDKYIISASSKKMEMGDSFVFGFGIHNLYPKEYRFRPTVEATRADITIGGLLNPTTFDPEVMATWFSDDFFNELEIEGSSYVIVPMKVTVGPEKGVDDPTLPGSYYFEISGEYYDEGAEKWKEYYGFAKKTLHIKVEE
ncbi:hypothetical protein JW930_03105 [Candidatus Woesearchaeota archaeon]|nr:hypothetical protein [Candidatus Woesearchaeota archaeon]